MTPERMYEALVEFERCQNPTYFIQKYFKEATFTNDDWQQFHQMRKQDKILQRLKLNNRV